MAMDAAARREGVVDVELSAVRVRGERAVVVGAGEDHELAVAQARADGEPLPLLRHATAEGGDGVGVDGDERRRRLGHRGERVGGEVFFFKQKTAYEMPK